MQTQNPGRTSPHYHIRYNDFKREPEKQATINRNLKRALTQLQLSILTMYYHQDDLVVHICHKLDK